MNKKVLKTLEYDKIIERLTEHASSEMGKVLCRQLLPSSDYEEILRRQDQTRDALSRLYKVFETGRADRIQKRIFNGIGAAALMLDVSCQKYVIEVFVGNVHDLCRFSVTEFNFHTDPSVDVSTL